MGDQQHRRAGGLLDVAEHLHHLGLHGHVESGGRLVGDEDLRLVGDRHGDHGPLAHPAGILVGKLVDPTARFGHADQVEQFDRPGPGRLLGDVAVGSDRLDDLRTDREHRVQRGHRVLEDHRDVVPTHSPHVAIGERQQVSSLEGGPARDTGRLGVEAHEGECAHRLARARLADDREHLSGMEFEAHVADGLDDARLRREADVETFDDEDRISHRCPPSRCAPGGRARLADRRRGS